MKFIKFIFSAVLLSFLFVGCSSDDSGGSSDADTGWLEFTINGELMTGDYKIEQTSDYVINPNYSGGSVSGILLPSNNPDLFTAMLTFSDENQNLLSIMSFVVEVGQVELINFQILAGISGFSPFLPQENFSLTVTQYETANVSYSPTPLLREIKGSFSGSVGAANMSDPDDVKSHTISGDFYIKQAL